MNVGYPSEELILALMEFPYRFSTSLFDSPLDDILVAYSVTAGSNKSLQSGPRSCICMIVCIGFGLSP